MSKTCFSYFRLDVHVWASTEFDSCNPPYRVLDRRCLSPETHRVTRCYVLGKRAQTMEAKVNFVIPSVPHGFLEGQSGLPPDKR